jgi:hypothetical protein
MDEDHAQAKALDRIVRDAPFDDTRADIILRSSDKIGFATFMLPLALASPVFASMYTLPQAPPSVNGNGNASGDTPIVPISEPSPVVQKLLMFCHPGYAPVLQDTKEWAKVLSAAVKYEMEGIIGRIRSSDVFRTACLEDPLEIFAVAVSLRLKAEAEIAAKHTLRFEQSKLGYVPELDHISAGNLQRLNDWRFLCGEVARKTWMDLPSRSTCDRCELEWYDTWTGEYANALSARPCQEAVADVMRAKVLSEIQCSYCRETIPSLREKESFLAARVVEVVSKVGPVLPETRLTDSR